VVRTLVALKKKYPDRVTLILGNRDLNKMRWTAQLAFKPESYDPQTGHATWTEWNALERVDGPCWVADVAKRAGMTPMAYYRKALAKQKGVAAVEVSEDDVRQFDTVANRIRWHFKEMMGADGEFERRQAELAHLSKKAEATEHDVVWSTIESTKSGGFMREYIELGQLAHLHEKCLYVHGGIVGGACRPDEHALGAMPNGDERINDVHEWVAALNAWKTAQVQEWIDNQLWSGEIATDAASQPDAGIAVWKTRDGYTLGGGGQVLQDYGLFVDHGPSVVLGRHLQKTGMPMSVPDEAMEILNKGGIRRLVVGHTPHGTCPTIIKSGGPGMTEPGLLVVMADTSYSDMKAPDNRGRAVSEVQLFDDGQVRVHGVLPDGRQLGYTLPDGVGEDEPPQLVGWDVPPIAATAQAISTVGKDVHRMLGTDAYFVKAFIENESEQVYLLQHVNGFVNKYVNLRPHEVTRIFEAQLEAMAHGNSADADDAEQPAMDPQQGDVDTTGSIRQAMITMHLLGDEEGAPGSERHEHALQAIEKQAVLFLDDKSADNVVVCENKTRTISTSFRVAQSQGSLAAMMKAMLSSTPDNSTKRTSTRLSAEGSGGDAAVVDEGLGPGELSLV